MDQRSNLIKAGDSCRSPGQKHESEYNVELKSKLQFNARTQSTPFLHNSSAAFYI